MADKKSRESIGELKIKLDVDVSEALTGLKAVQREAKKASQALRELEENKPVVEQTFNITINHDGQDAQKLLEIIEKELATKLKIRGIGI